MYIHETSKFKKNKKRVIFTMITLKKINIYFKYLQGWDKNK